MEKKIFYTLMDENGANSIELSVPSSTGTAEYIKSFLTIPTPMNGWLLRRERRQAWRDLWKLEIDRRP